MQVNRLSKSQNQKPAGQPLDINVEDKPNPFVNFFKKKRDFSLENILFTLFNTGFLVFIALMTLYPYLNTLAISFNEGFDSLRGGIYILPREFSLMNYEAIFAMGSIQTAFLNSVLRTVLGAATSVLAASMLGYALSRKEFVFRRIFTLMLVLTMYVNAGLIPNYFNIRNLGLTNTFAVYILPGMVSAFNVIIIRTYIQGLPAALLESARIDGAGDFRIYRSIILPLSLPVLATVTLFAAVGAWNAWFDNYIYNARSANLTTLQYELMKLISSTTSMSQSSSAVHGVGVDATTAVGMITPKSIRSAITIVASLPILMVYPFLQKYFVTGLTIGSVKA